MPGSNDDNTTTTTTTTTINNNNNNKNINNILYDTLIKMGYSNGHNKT